jgi:hypothetical protein
MFLSFICTQSPPEESNTDSEDGSYRKLSDSPASDEEEEFEPEPEPKHAKKRTPPKASRSSCCTCYSMLIVPVA